MGRHSPIIATVRTFEVIEALVGVRGLSLAHLAQRTGLSHAHVWKILAGLESAGYVTQDPQTGSYFLTYKLVNLGQRHADAVRNVELCQPLLDGLAQHTGELVQLALLDGDQLRFVAKAEGTERITVRSLLGAVVDLHATAAGKAWLSTLPEAEAISHLRSNKLARITPYTIVSLGKLRLALQAARSNGYAIVEEEHLKGANAVAAPVMGPGSGGRGIGAVVVTGPSFRMPPHRLLELAAGVIEAASGLSHIFGWSVAEPKAQATSQRYASRAAPGAARSPP